MPHYSPQLIQTMHDTLEAVMTSVPMGHATPGVKAHLAEIILQTAAQGLTSYDSLVAAASDPDSNDYLDAHLIKNQCSEGARTALCDRFVRYAQCPLRVIRVVFNISVAHVRYPAHLRPAIPRCEH